MAWCLAHMCSMNTEILLLFLKLFQLIWILNSCYINFTFLEAIFTNFKDFVVEKYLVWKYKWQKEKVKK